MTHSFRPDLGLTFSTGLWLTPVYVDRRIPAGVESTPRGPHRSTGTGSVAAVRHSRSVQASQTQGRNPVRGVPRRLQGATKAAVPETKGPRRKLTHSFRPVSILKTDSQFSTRFDSGKVTHSFWGRKILGRFLWTPIPAFPTGKVGYTEQVFDRSRLRANTRSIRTGVR